jgi:hypothetical protein
LHDAEQTTLRRGVVHRDDAWASTPGSLLVNWLYYQSVGHTVEALRIAVAFRAANPRLHIAVLLNARTGTELVACVPEVDTLYTLDIGTPESPVPPPSLDQIPRDWDYVFTDGRAERPSAWPSLDACHARLRDWLRPGAVNGRGLPARIDDLPHVAARFQLPEAAREYGQRFWAGAGEPRLTLLPGSGSGSAPSLAFWTALLERTFDAYPDAEVAILGSSDRRRSWTLGFTPVEVGQLRRRFPGVRDAFDVGLLNQLAIAEQAAVHISPHSGMSFAVQCVGTPWLVISGGLWPEYLLNGVPHLSVYPVCDRYPCFDRTLDECQERRTSGRRVICRDDEALTEKLPEVLDGLRVLLRGKLSAAEAAARHYAELRRRRAECADPLRESLWDWPAFVTPAPPRPS